MFIGGGDAWIALPITLITARAPVSNTLMTGLNISGWYIFAQNSAMMITNISIQSNNSIYTAPFDVVFVIGHI
jgi:hypothetical protein